MGKRIVITGASSGIGAATAEAFASQGAQLVLAARGEEGLARVAERCRTLGGEAATQAVDVADAEAVGRLAAFASAEMGGIDLWFSAAGVGIMGAFQDVPMDAHRQVIATNLLGHMNDAHAVLPIFLGQGHGTFVNMISVGGFLATPQAAAYSASKFGLRGFSEALRGELSLHPGIHVCDVYPTFVDTPGVSHAGNQVGRRLSVPPGVLDPRRVAAAVVRLADRPRNTTVLGAPAIALKLAQFLTPNLGAAAMDGFLRSYFDKAEEVEQTDGSLFAPSGPAGEVDGGFRRPDQRRTAAVAAGAVAGVAALGVAGLLLARRR